MKTIIAYFSKKSGDMGRGGALFSGAFDEGLVQHPKMFERLFLAYLLYEEESYDVLSITLRTLEFYDALCDPQCYHRSAWFWPSTLAMTPQIWA